MYFPEIIRGIGTLTVHFLRNLFFSRDANPDILARPRGFGKSDNVTLQYPEEKAPYPPGYRGLHRLVPRGDGKPRCVACYMCATACPAQCIYIEAGEVEGDPIEKYPVKFVIDELRCVVCGFCVEACPKDAIRMDTGEHAPPTLDASGQVARREGAAARAEPVDYRGDPWLRRDGPLHPGRRAGRHEGRRHAVPVDRHRRVRPDAGLLGASSWRPRPRPAASSADASGGRRSGRGRAP